MFPLFIRPAVRIVLLASLAAGVACAQFGLTPAAGGEVSGSGVLPESSLVSPRELAARFAPVVRQDTAGAGNQDWITAANFDGDWDSANNWENQGLQRGDRRRFPHRAVVYWSAVATSSHTFLHFAWFHPRDWGRGALENHGFRSFLRTASFGRISHSAHENDLEGALVVVENRGPSGEPRVVAVETIFHRQFLRYSVAEGLGLRQPAEPQRWPQVAEVRDQLRAMKGTIPLTDEGRPIVMVESHGHGVEGWDGQAFPGKHDDGVVYVPEGVAEDPEDTPFVGEDARFYADRQGRVREVSYALVSTEGTLWRRAQAGESETFAKAQPFAGYNPNSIGYAFRGDTHEKNAAAAPWGWVDETPGMPRGTLFFDPAKLVKIHYETGEGFSLRYVYHPFLQIVDEAAE